VSFTSGILVLFFPGTQQDYTIAESKQQVAEWPVNNKWQPV
jgi:hypothetical protein